MLKFLDIFFTLFHTFLILFNLFGWLIKKTRILNFISLFITGFSWTFLGIFYGFGYCPLTDWHFKILKKLGYLNLPDSYISFLIQKYFNLYLNQNLVELFTIILFSISFIISFILNLHELKMLLIKIKFFIFLQKSKNE